MSGPAGGPVVSRGVSATMADFELGEQNPYVNVVCEPFVGEAREGSASLSTRLKGIRMRWMQLCQMSRSTHGEP